MCRVRSPPVGSRQVRGREGERERDRRRWRERGGMGQWPNGAVDQCLHSTAIPRASHGRKAPHVSHFKETRHRLVSGQERGTRGWYCCNFYHLVFWRTSGENPHRLGTKTERMVFTVTFSLEPAVLYYHIVFCPTDSENAFSKNDLLSSVRSSNLVRGTIQIHI